MTYRLLRPDGTILWLEKSARAFFDDQGKMLRMIGMVADVTERKKAEEAVLQRDRKSTRLNSSHTVISYAVFCLKKKKKREKNRERKRIRVDVLINKDEIVEVSVQ